MEKQDLKILIIGKAGIGKSTIAALIDQFLKGLKFDVEIADDDVYVEEMLSRVYNCSNIVDKLKIEIETKRTVGEPFKH